MSARAQLRACAASFTFLSRIPCRLVAHDLRDLPGAAVYFPVVGLVVGLAGSAVFALGIMIWPPALALVVSVAATVWITGAFHEDALADALDGFGGGWGKAQVLAIMKDSRVGSYALIGVLLVVAAKLSALYGIFDVASADGTRPATIAVARALVCAHVLGRWSSAALLFKYPYVRVAAPDERSSAGRPFVGGVTWRRLAAASTIALTIVGVALGIAAVATIVAAVVVIVLAGRYFNRRIGGITGDALGAANQAVELAVYLVLAAHW